MKIKLLIISLILIVVPIINIANASDYESVIRGYHMENNKIDGDVMYFDDLIIEQIDAKTFQNPESINMDYGHDKNNVYYQGEYILEGLNPKDYTIGFPINGEDIDKYIAYDKNTICIKENCVEVGNTDNIIFIEDYVFFVGGSVYKPVNGGIKKISDNVDLDKFTFGYNITDDAVYWYGTKIEEADAETFEIYDWAKWSKDSQFAHDKNNVYLNGELVYDADVETFSQKRIYDENGEIVDNVVLDKDHVFYRDKYLTIGEIKEEYPQESENINKSIQSAIEEYESKYPGYEPQPAKPPITAKNVWPYAVGALVVLAGAVGVAGRKKRK